MSKKAVYSMVLLFVLMGVLGVVSNVHKVEAQYPIIYIKADGSIDPPTANITSLDNVTYTFTADINASIYVERSNIIIDGNTHTLKGNESGNGIDLTGISNVTVRNLEVRAFGFGVRLDLSSNVTVTNNNITNTKCAIYLWRSSNNTAARNTLANNIVVDVYLGDSSHNRIHENTIVCSGEQFGIQLSHAHNNSLLANNITGSQEMGIGIAYSNHTVIFGNNISNSSNAGIQLQFSSSNNDIVGNNVTSSRYGIELGWTLCSDNTIHGNIVTNSSYGIALHRAPSNDLSGNIVKNSSYGFDVGGNELVHFMNWIDTSNLVDGKPVYYYVNETDLVVDSATHPQVGYLALVNCKNVIVENQTLTGNGQGLLLAFSNDSYVRNSNITMNLGGLHLISSSNITVFGNNITSNEEFGIYADWYSSHITILRNNIANSSDGILTFLSFNNTISENTIAENTYGINANEVTSNSTISRNTIIENNCGIYLSPDYPLHLYHNNFINNTQQVFLDLYINHSWDNGFEGNYWSNYTGVDLNHDGIGDSSHEIGANNMDHYPLMGPFHSYNTTLGKHVNVISNSTIESFQHFESNSTIIMHVSNMTADQTHGFCRISIPYEVMSGPFNVTIDGANPTYWNYTLYDDGKNRWIYFEYEHTTRKIVIIPEFQSFLILATFMIATLLASVLLKKRKHLSSDWF